MSEPQGTDPVGIDRMETAEARIARLERTVAELQRELDLVRGRAGADRAAIDFAAWHERQYRNSPTIIVVGLAIIGLFALIFTLARK